MSETWYFASDHAGPALRAELMAVAADLGLKTVDLGPPEGESVDYPDYANRLADALGADPDGKGVLICGTGIGISIAINRHRHVRGALCHDITTARLCREHNDANVLVLGARVVGGQVAADCLKVFAGTEFEGGRHQRRVGKLS